MKFYGRVLSSTSKNWLNFGGDLGIVRWVNEQKNTVIVVAYPDRGEGNDPEPFFFFFFFFFRGVGSLSQPRLNIFTVDNMGVMICLGQGGLRSLSASSFVCYLPRCHFQTGFPTERIYVIFITTLISNWINQPHCEIWHTACGEDYVKWYEIYVTLQAILQEKKN